MTLELLKRQGEDVTHRNRMLASIRGEPVDHVPFAPRWELWFDSAVLHGTLPERLKGLDLFGATQEMGWGIKGFKAPMYRPEVRNTNVRETVHEKDGARNTVTEYETPFGTVSKLFRESLDLIQHGVRGLEIEHMIKGVEDYDATIHVIENTEVVPTYDELREYDASIGDDGVPIGDAGWCPFHQLMREFVGYENTYYQLHDHPKQFARLLKAMDEYEREVVKVAVESPMLVLRHDGNHDSYLTPPPIFDEYFLPFFQHFTSECRKHGKLSCTHTDGNQSLLLAQIRDSGFAICEAFTSPPMTPTSIADARMVWGPEVVIWGGIASVMLTPEFSEMEFEKHIVSLIRQAAPGNRFIMGTGDNLPTDGLLERMERVDELCKTEGRYPVPAN
jgi:uroporphyrinogen-III decarboxylase